MEEISMFPVTYALVAITSIVSFLALNNIEIKRNLIFYPYGMRPTSQYYRFLSHGLIHANFLHLFLNMFTLYSFGRLAEIAVFNKPQYVVFYISALAASSIFDFFKNKDNPSYTALGASGAVSAVLFATIMLDPWARNIEPFGIPVLAMPNIVFAFVYLYYCYYMDKKGTDNIGHSAHMWGAVYGFVFTAFVNPALLVRFGEMLLHPRFDAQ
jgi:membrane associated rhomboid family serine protease